VQVRADPVQLGGDFGAGALGQGFIQQPTENQPYKQPLGQRKRFFLQCGNKAFIVPDADPQPDTFNHADPDQANERQ